MKPIKIKSRAIAIFIRMATDQEPEIYPQHFQFTGDADGRVGGKTAGEWEREYAGTRDSVINQFNRSYGDEQRRIRKLSKSTMEN